FRSCCFLLRDVAGEAGKADNKARHANLRANVKKLRYDAPCQVLTPECLCYGRLLCFSFLRYFRHPGKQNQHANGNHCERDNEVRHLDGVSFHLQVSFQLVGRHCLQFTLRVLDPAEDKLATEYRGKKCTEPVKRLSEV